MTVIQIGHENRLISFTFCSHFQRLFQIRKCFICPTLHWLNTRNRCLRKNVLIIIISGLQLRLIPTTDPSSGKQRSCSPLWKHQVVPNPLPGEANQGVIRDASHLRMYTAFLLQMPFYLGLPKQFTNSYWPKLHSSPWPSLRKKNPTG